MNALETLLTNLFRLFGSEAAAIARRMASVPGGILPMTRRLGGETDMAFYRRSVTRLVIFVVTFSLALILASTFAGYMGEGLKVFIAIAFTAITLFFLGRLYIAGIPAILGIEMFIEGSQLRQYTRGMLVVATAVALVAIVVAVTPFHESWKGLGYVLLFGVVGTLALLSGWNTVARLSFVVIGFFVLSLVLFTEDTRESFATLGDRVQNQTANTIDCVANDTVECIDEDKRPIRVPQGTVTVVGAHFFPKHGRESVANEELCSSGNTTINLKVGDNWERVHNPNPTICALKVDWDLSLPFVTRSMAGKDLVWLPSNHTAYVQHVMPSARWHEFHLPSVVRPPSR